MREVTLENLVAGAILKFGFVDSLDMTLLMSGMKNKIVYQKITGLAKYIDYDKNQICLQQGYALDTNLRDNEDKPFLLKDYLYLKQGSIVKKYLETLNLKQFVLRKIKLLFSVRKDNLNNLFNEVELATLGELFALGLITEKWNDDVPYEDYEEVVITKQGEVELFLIDNAVSVQAFEQTLESFQYDSSLLRDFLASIPDLDSYVLTKYSVGDFELFGRTYDRSVLK